MRRIAVACSCPLLLLVLCGALTTGSELPAPPPEPPDAATVADEPPAPIVPAWSPTPEEVVRKAVDAVLGEEICEAEIVEFEPGDRFLGEVPDELLGTGDATLHLWLLDRDTGGPVAAPVRLWRLDVPEGGGFTAGDQIQRTLEVPAEGASIEDLPEGWYRVQCDAQRKGAEDPARFWVADGANPRHVELAMPRTLRSRLRVFDESGEEVREGRLELRGPTSSSSAGLAPGWARPRREKDAPEMLSWGFTVCGGCAGWRLRKDERAGPEGFDLGTLQESSRSTSRSRVHRLLVAGRNEVSVLVSGSLGRDTTFAAPVVPLARILGTVRLPGGDPLPPGRAEVSATAQAVPVGEGEARDAWRSVPVAVKVSCPGCRPLEFEWRIDERPVERVLVPAE